MEPNGAAGRWLSLRTATTDPPTEDTSHGIYPLMLRLIGSLNEEARKAGKRVGAVLDTCQLLSITAL